MMPLRRKVFQTGGSKAITLPKSWLELHEEKIGKEIDEVLIEVDGELVVKPMITEATDKHANRGGGGGSSERC